MKKNKISFWRNTILGVSVLIFSSCSSIQKDKNEDAKDSEVELCVGDYQTPEQAKEQLAKFASTYSNVEEWEARVKKTRKGFWEGAKLDSVMKYRDLPFNTIVGKVHQMNGYTITNIAIEALPGHYITGNLYKPNKIKKGKAPIVLSPHGHGFRPDDYGRFRPSEQKMCGSYAKMGAVAFAYDMIGYGENSGYKHLDPNAVQIQTYQSIRALDYLCSLDYTDSTKVGITGSSGGGTQSLYLSVADPRVTVVVPVVMTSSYFFGGCSCESGMPVHKSKIHETNNVDLAAMFAPKAALFISDGHDWTANFPEIGFPYIKNVYKLYGAEDMVENLHLANEFHDYGFSKRKAAYKFFAKHLNLDYSVILNDNKEVVEDDILVIAIQELKVFQKKPLVFIKDWSFELSDIYLQRLERMKEEEKINQNK
jgi:hypothetical protein